MPRRSILGISYEFGRGVDQDDEAAGRWYKEAAGRGHAGTWEKYVELRDSGRIQE